MVIGFTKDFAISNWAETCYNSPAGTSLMDTSDRPYTVTLNNNSGLSSSGDQIFLYAPYDCIIQFDWNIMSENRELLRPSRVPVAYQLDFEQVVLNTVTNGTLTTSGMNVQVQLRAMAAFYFILGPTVNVDMRRPSNKRHCELLISNFMVQSTTPQPDGLQVYQNPTFQNPVSDQGSRAHTDIIFWSPLYYNTDYFYLGMYPQKVDGYPDPPPQPVATQPVFSPNNLSCLSSPSDFTLIWSCTGNDQASNLGIFNPVAPEGFIALGSVATTNFNVPPDQSFYNQLRCVKSSLCKQVTLSKANLIWTDQGSGAPKDVSVWLLPNAGCCVATIGIGYPDSVEVWDLIEAPGS